MGPPWRLLRWISDRAGDPSLCVQRFHQLSRRPHAYNQLLKYREALENPPLLVVCDMDRLVIHTNFTA
ncbi:MAG TPA: hypothetical protein VJ739_17340, partial [Gemmataceae bacterium]|nr:hypothetical protein [Gemmataceae bacterium]